MQQQLLHSADVFHKVGCDTLLSLALCKVKALPHRQQLACCLLVLLRMLLLLLLLVPHKVGLARDKEETLIWSRDQGTCFFVPCTFGRRRR